MSQKYVVFCDTQNKVVDEEYADQIRAEFRRQTGWKVEKDTPIWNDLTKFSLGYSVQKRSPVEVVGIFRIANGLLKLDNKDDDSGDDE